ncbi:MAG: flagellar filament capping protein FliD, partial [Phycisphaerales bacterium]
MGGITSGVGIFSGIDTGSLISQLLAVEARPRTQAQARIAQLQLQNAAYLDLNSKLTALKTASGKFRESKTFQTKKATSSDEASVTATASNTAAEGSYRMLVDRLVSTQQVMSRGFANRDTSAVGATSITLESADARLDRDVSLSDLRNGAGISRGRITITDSGNRSATIDLSRATSVNEVLDAINNNGTARVTAKVQDGRFVVTDTLGGSFTVADAGGYTTATSLGIAGTATGTLTGSTVYGLNANTSLAALNDGVGVSIRPTSTVDGYSFKISVDDGSDVTEVSVNLGDVYELRGAELTLTKVAGAVTTVGGAVDRINEALSDAGVTGVSASIDSTNGRLIINDTQNTRTLSVTENNGTTAAELGLISAGGGASSLLQGKRLLAGLNSTLASSLNGGAGVGGDGALSFTTRSGYSFSVNVSGAGTVADVLSAITAASGTVSGAARVTASMNANGTGLMITDNTGGTGNLIITGTTGNDSAASLGISTGASGVAASTKEGSNLQHRYIGRGTLLSAMNGGRGIGTGKFTITDSTGAVGEVDIGSDSATLGDVIDEINSRGLRVRARVNSNGDGMEIYEDIPSGQTAGSVKIKVEDTRGTVAKLLNIRGEASAVGSGNVINGSLERRIELSATDTLAGIATKINAAGAGVTASVIRDGDGTTPFRLSMSSSVSGREGRFVLGSAGVDFGLTTLDAGQDSRVFFGANDPARALVAGGSTNTVDTLLAGVRIDLKQVTTEAIGLTVSSDTAAIETAIGAFVEVFNTAVDRIENYTKYNETTKKGGVLLGDSTAIELRSALFRTVQG